MRGADLRVLGQVELHVAGRPVALGGPVSRSVLAALALNAGQVVPLGTLVTAAWGDEAPATAGVQVRNRISTLRQALPPRAEPWIETQGSGYRLRLGDARLDLAEFSDLVAQGDRLAGEGARQAAATVLRRALTLFRGPALDQLTSAWMRAHAQRLEQLRLTALERRIEIDLGLGLHRELIDELTALVAEYPYREQLRAHLMLAYYRSGRRVEALEAYRATRQLLAAETGLEPGLALRRLHEAMLRAEPDLMAESPVVDRPAVPRRPRQLPADVPALVGRDAEVATLVDALTAGAGTAPATWVVTGAGGVGKSALAVHVGHRLADRYAGQLYVNLQGATEGAQPVQPAVVLARFMRACGVPPAEVPIDEAEATALFRSILADRPMLLLLDDAKDSAQVRPLLPGAAGCAVLVTSRSALTTLTGAQHLHLGEVGGRHAVEMLAAVVGDGRIAADPAGATRLAELCGRLPLALTIAGARLVSRPGWSPTDLAGQLAGEAQLLSGLSHGDLTLRSTFAVSYDGLGEHAAGGEAATAFRRLGVLDVPSPTLAVTAAMLGRPIDRVGPAVELLVDARLVECPAPGSYRLHDLLRAYARQLTARSDPAPVVQDAVRRALRYYLDTARAAIDVLRPGTVWSDGKATVAGSGPGFVGTAQAVAWLEAERANLVAATAAYATVPDTAPLSVALAEPLNHYLGTHGHFHDWRTVTVAALAAARLTGDRKGRGRALSAIAGVHVYAGDLSAAQTALQESLTLAEEDDDPHARMRAWTNLATVHSHRRDLDASLDAMRRALDCNRLIGDRKTEALLLNNIGDILLDLGRPDEAAGALTTSLSLFRQQDDPVGEAMVLSTAARVQTALGQHEAAFESLNRCLQLCRTCADQQGEYDALLERAKVHHSAGRPDAARTDAEEALRLCRAAGDRPVEDRARRLLASLG